MARIAILSCQRIRDKSCVACAKCFKAMSNKDGQFARYEDDIELMALGNCGDCPGLVMPKVTLMNEVAQMLGREYDTIHLGTCIVKAKKTAQCPIDFDQLRGLLKENFGKELVVGTHDY